MEIKYKVGDYIKSLKNCIKINGTKIITIGKYYKIVDDDENMFKIIDDKNNDRWEFWIEFDDSFVYEKNKIREYKLKKILN